MRGQRVHVTVAPAVALASAPALALLPVPEADQSRSAPAAAGAAGAGSQAAGEGGATPLSDWLSRPGCAQRARLAGSLPLRPRASRAPHSSRAPITVRAWSVATGVHAGAHAAPEEVTHATD